jgi:hypothetical protein
MGRKKFDAAAGRAIKEALIKSRRANQVPAGAKTLLILQPLSARLKPCPFNAEFIQWFLIDPAL